MAQISFDFFCDELTVLLVDSLGEGAIEGALVETLALCAAEAEALCSGRPIACGRGCPHCCVLNVAVLLPEALLLAEWITRQRADAERRETGQLRYDTPQAVRRAVAVSRYRIAASFRYP